MRPTLLSAAVHQSANPARTGAVAPSTTSFKRCQHKASAHSLSRTHNKNTEMAHACTKAVSAWALRTHSRCMWADVLLLLMQHGLGEFAAEMAMTAAEFGESLTIGSYKVPPSGFSRGYQ